MEKVGEHEEKIIEEASSAVEETRNDKEDERIRGTETERFDPVDSTEEGSMVTFEDQENEMKDEEVLELFRRNNSVRPEVTERNNFPYLQSQEDTVTETEQGNVVFHSFNDSSEIPDLGVLNLDSPERLEGVKPSSASNEDTEDLSSDSDLDSNLSRYYFDGSLPVSAYVEESETHQDERPVPEHDNQMPLLCPKQTIQRPTSWRTCCGLLALLRAAEP